MTAIRQSLVIRPGAAPERRSRAIAAEAAVALVHDGSTTAVMMATPADLEDFAVGFARSEGLIGSLTDIDTLEVFPEVLGVEARMWLKADRSAELTRRRRAIAGPTGCGLCGVESLEAAARPAARVTSDLRVSVEAVRRALDAMAPLQVMGRETRAMHAAAFADRQGAVTLLREDVGRHNALDKLGGALLRQDVAADRGMVLVTSRLSVEMVQKTAMIGAPVLVAVSAPTELALDTAAACGLTVIAVARSDAFEVFTGAERLLTNDPAARDHVA